MNTVLTGYELSGATWFYLSLLLILTVFFRFNRFWSLRNLDLTLLLSVSPGLLLVGYDRTFGYCWLFSVAGVLLIRVLCERRPRLDQNLNVPGLWFLGTSAFAFLMAIVVTQPVEESTAQVVRRADQMIRRQEATGTESAGGPAPSLLAAPVLLASGSEPLDLPERAAGLEVASARVLAILSHSAVLAALLLIGHWHFRDLQIGLAMGTLYLLLPCTAFDVGEVNHVLPSALILWAFVFVSHPIPAGLCMGLACGTVFFPVFLLPLWLASYDRRGRWRFCTALAAVAAVLMGSFALTSPDVLSFSRQLLGSIDWSVLEFHGGTGNGFWNAYDSAWRIPVFVAFAIMLVVLTVWPARKSLEHLIGGTAAIVLGTQFWYPHQGGVYVLWYVPLALLVVFRPRLLHGININREADRHPETAVPAPGRPVAEPVHAGAGLSDLLR